MVRAYVHVCAAKHCYNTRKTHPDKAFFGFPSDINLCKIWLKNCERLDLASETVLKSNGYYKLCGDHFEEKWFTDNSKCLLNRNIDPVPTIFVNNIDSLCPSRSRPTSLEIDLPELDDSSQDVHPENVCECVLDPSELMVDSNREYPSISYNTIQIATKKRLDATSISQALINLSPETELHIIDELCRFCLNKAADNCVNIFSNTDKAKEIRTICKTVLPKRMSMCDSLPHWACDECVQDLSTCQRLLEQFRKADEYLRAIARFSLYVDVESASEATDDDEYVSEEEIVKPIPKGSLIIPFNNFNNVMNESVSYITRMSMRSSTSKKNTSKENIEPEKNDIQIDVNTGRVTSLSQPSKPLFNTTTTEGSIAMFTNSTSSSINQLLSLPAPGMDLFPPDNEVFKDKVELICDNILLLPPEEEGPEKSAEYLNQLNESPVTNENISLLNLGGHLKPIEDSLLNPEIINVNDDTSPKDGTMDDKACIKLNIFESNESSNFSVTFKCLECSKMYSSYQSLVEHVINSHHKEDKTLYNCRACTKVFASALLLAQHLKKESHYGKYRCLKCESNELFNNRGDLERHNRIAHSVKCKFCEARFLSGSSMELHMTKKHYKVHMSQLKTCSTCDKEFKSVASRRIHEYAHHREREICWICGIILTTTANLRKHIQLHMDNEFVCDVCGRPFSTKLYLDKHKLRHKPNYHDKKYKCEFCLKSFISKENLKRHTYTHTTAKPYTCEFCQMGFVEKGLLLGHLRKRGLLNDACPQKNEMVYDKVGFLKRRKLSFQCDICGRKFYKRTNAERHRKFHFCSGNTEVVQKLLEESEMHECEICNKILFSKITLQKHIGRQHTQDPKPITCDFCEKTFATYNQIYVHERIHTGEKPFKCSLCDMAFRRKKSLQSHELSHTEDRPYICEVCGKAFKSNARLVVHTGIHFKAPALRKRHSCQLCDQRFVQSKSLRLHMRKHHSTVGEEEIKYPCYDCGEMFLTTRSLEEHKKEVHNNEDEDGEYEYDPLQGEDEEGLAVQYLTAEGQVIEGQVITDDMDMEHFTYVILPEETCS